MKEFERRYPLFSLCGLNCGLCPMHLNGYCPGCGGGKGNQSCAIARCSLGRGGIEFCCDCIEYPCAQYQAMTEYDSFLSHRHMAHDLARLQQIGLDAYRAELEEKIKILHTLLDGYNDGRRKTFFCTAVALLDLDVIRDVMDQLTQQENDEMVAREKAACAARLFEEAAKQRKIVLKLCKKPKKTAGAAR
ncbi:DUF3795 domain-containing protein [Anaerotruncus colihominis]|uniref:DUF3795 domain-containing protein n=1 Tax=Anaerotruncus colihominis TaxID=169435 RepID=A0A845SY26_9FIRM|nr:DUF3795 domain-containing protein [Anaerotruncus colihominis]MCR2024455.1 DUF3795 domain-containing protein [Anaerotruncus colihominis]NDO39818.1 DUF3795 domain-containing protein [Anaerotruncus colihominis]